MRMFASLEKSDYESYLFKEATACLLHVLKFVTGHLVPSTKVILRMPSIRSMPLTSSCCQ